MKTTTSGASGPIMDTTNEPGAGEHQGLPLNASVRDALLAYLANMDGHEIRNLYALVLEEVERPLFEVVLHHTRGNLSQAAKVLGMTRATLRKRLDVHGIERG